MQYTDQIMMIRPASFRMNEQTSVNNYYQKESQMEAELVKAKAIEEFDAFVAKLTAKGVKVEVVQDTEDPNTPDALFPNNWISFHADGRVGLYPMYAENRRSEVRMDIIESLQHRFKVDEVVDYTDYADKDIFLEGTGSMILDRDAKIAYCALSPRSDKRLFEQFCEDFGYEAISFVSNQTVEDKRLAIYHSNVMMCIADRFAVICLDSIDDSSERLRVKSKLENSGKEIIEISEAQVNQFAGNMLQVKGDDEDPILVMSSSAYRSLSMDQERIMLKYGSILHSDLNTIETLGGGSARCMMAELFLPPL